LISGVLGQSVASAALSSVFVGTMWITRPWRPNPIQDEQPVAPGSAFQRCSRSFAGALGRQVAQVDEALHHLAGRYFADDLLASPHLPHVAGQLGPDGAELGILDVDVARSGFFSLTSRHGLTAISRLPMQ